MNYVKEYNETLKLAKMVKRKLSKVKIGLPTRVEFKYNEGVVVCYPKLKKWIVTPKGKKPVIHFINKDSRNDVTKYKARRFLKLAIIKLLRDDTSLNA